jgi:hypothetical protein
VVKRITTGEGSWEHAITKHRDVYQAGRNRAASFIRENGLTPFLMWASDLDWHGTADECFSEFEALGFGDVRLSPEAWSEGNLWWGMAKPELVPDDLGQSWRLFVVARRVGEAVCQPKGGCMRTRFIWLVCVLFLVTVGCTEEQSTGDGFSNGDTATVPDVVGLDLQSAQDELQAAGFYNLGSHDVTGESSFQVLDRNWEVVEQIPEAGEEASIDQRVELGVRRR